MSSSPAPLPIPQDPGPVSDDVRLPGSPANADDIGIHASEVVALEDQLGTLHGCDGLTKRSHSRVVCE